MPSSNARSALGGGASDVARPGSTQLEDGAPDRDPGGDQRRRAVGVQGRHGAAPPSKCAQQRHREAAADRVADVRSTWLKLIALPVSSRDGVDDQSRHRREGAADAEADDAHRHERLPQASVRAKKTIASARSTRRRQHHAGVPRCAARGRQRAARDMTTENGSSTSPVTKTD